MTPDDSTVKGRVSLESGQGRTWVRLEAQPLGNEWLVVITNDYPHLGAVAIGDFDATSGRASASVITLPGHRDDVVARAQAQNLARALQRRVCVVVGIHIDNASQEEIGAILCNAEKLTRTLSDACQPGTS